MTICFGKTSPKTRTPEASTVAEQSSGSKSSEESLGETMGDLPRHDFVDPDRMVEKMTSSMANPRPGRLGRVSNKCNLL
jgi:hypothetical protein